MQLRHERTTNAVEKTDDSRLPLSPMKIWVVNITDTGGETPEERELRRLREEFERSAERRSQEESDLDYWRRRQTQRDANISSLPLCLMIVSFGIVLPIAMSL